MKVLLTHSEGRLEALNAALTARGFTVTHAPLIRTELLPAEAVRPGAEALLTSDWLLLTSRTAVAAWAALGLPLSGIAPKIGVVGKKTGDAVAELGGEVALVAQPANAEGLLETFLAHVTGPLNVGLPCGEDALPTLSDGLSAAGFPVSRVPLYHTVAQPMTNQDADIIVLASPSAVAALPKTILSKTRFVALGPSTYAALRGRNLEATMSQTPDVDSVVQAVIRNDTQLVPEAVELETP